MKVFTIGDVSWRDADTIRDTIAELPNGCTVLVRARDGADAIVSDVTYSLGVKLRKLIDSREVASGAIYHSFTKQIFREEHADNVEKIDSVIVFTSCVENQPGLSKVIALFEDAGVPVEIVRPKTPEVIDRFTGQFRFLSNFYACPITYEGIDYPSSEHAYQAAKFSNREPKLLIAASPNPISAKKLGYSAVLSSDWEERKISVMREIVREKFKNPIVRDMLLATGDAKLVEGNTWGDAYWGVRAKDGVGLNWLGRILTEVRQEIREEMSDSSSEQEE